MTIEELIQAYFEGETSLEQEQQIRDWFAITPLEQMTPELKQYAPLFGYISKEREELEKEDASAEIATTGGSLPKATPVLSQKKPPRSIKWIWYAASGAIAAALVIGIVLNSYLKPVISVSEDSYMSMTISGVSVEDEEAAKGFANEQMQKLSRMMNKGMADQKLGICKKMVLRADNLLNINMEEEQNN